MVSKNVLGLDEERNWGRERDEKGGGKDVGGRRREEDVICETHV